MTIRILFFIYSISMSLKLGFLFNGSTRYIPLRITILLSLIIFIYYLSHIKNIKIKKNHAIYIFTYVLIGVVYIVSWSDDSLNNITKNIIELLYPLLVLLNLSFFSSHLNDKTLNKGLLLFLYFSIFLILIETFIRLNYPEFAFKGEISEFLAEKNRNSIYIYKYGSIMFLDSNYTALHILALLGITLSLNSIPTIPKTLTFIIITILLFCTFSRAAYIAYFIIIYIYILSYISIKNRFIVLSITLLSVMIFIITNHNILPNDISFNSKLLTFKSLLKIQNTPIINIFFGYGFIDGGYIYSFREGAYAHTLIPLLLGEVGIIGLFIYISFLIRLIYIYPRNIGLVILPIIICGFSLVYPWDAIYIYTLFLLLKLNDKKTLKSC